MTLVCETLGKQAFPLGIIYSLGIITIRDILQFGSEEIKSTVLGGFVNGDPPVALGITEPQAGSDAAALKTTARFEGDEVVFNGQKMYCTLAGMAKYILLMTRDLQDREPLRRHIDVAAADRYSRRALQQRRKGGLVDHPHPTRCLSRTPACPKKNLVGELNRAGRS